MFSAHWKRLAGLCHVSCTGRCCLLVWLIYYILCCKRIAQGSSQLLPWRQGRAKREVQYCPGWPSWTDSRRSGFVAVVHPALHLEQSSGVMRGLQHQRTAPLLVGDKAGAAAGWR